MKQGWEIKKLGDVCDVLNGFAFDSSLFSDDSTHIPLIRIRDIKKGYTETFYKGSFSEDYIIKKGDYLIGMDGEFNIAEWSGINSLLNQRVCKLTVVDNKLLARYVLWFMPKALKKIEDETPFVTVKHLSSRKLLDISIPVPPLAEQERIVEELDLLSGIIEKQKQQLKELDNLAHSIFYDMFGDPITNEMGWEMVVFESACSSITKGPFGSDIKKSLYVERSDDAYKVYIQANAIEKDLTVGTYYISKEYFDEKMFRFEVHPYDYIITCDGTLGKFIRLPETVEKGIISASLLRLSIREEILSPKYFEFIWDEYMLPLLVKDVRNTALKHLPSAGKIGKVCIPLPDIKIQSEFASKVEAIEKQKELVKQSLAETETLFNSRMDYYFN